MIPTGALITNKKCNTHPFFYVSLLFFSRWCHLWRTRWKWCQYFLELYLNQTLKKLRFLFVMLFLVGLVNRVFFFLLLLYCLSLCCCRWKCCFVRSCYLLLFLASSTISSSSSAPPSPLSFSCSSFRYQFLFSFTIYYFCPHWVQKNNAYRCRACPCNSSDDNMVDGLFVLRRCPCHATTDHTQLNSSPKPITQSPRFVDFV